MPNSKNIIKRDGKVISPSLTREYPLVIEKAKGCYIFDIEGKRYLDFSAGVAVANVGHTNEQVIKAVQKQASKIMHYGFSDFYAELPVKFVEFLLTFLPNNFERAFLSNSGTESVEAAYKLARWHSNKKQFIAFKPSFHGRTMGSLSLTCSKPLHKERFGPFLPVTHVPYAYCYRCAYNKIYPDCGMKCLAELEKNVKALKNDLAGVIVEPVAGEGGYIVPPKEFHQGIRKICNDYNILLCADEIQAGCFRTGTFLAMENYKVEADIVCLSKALADGVPIGVTLSSKKIMDWPAGAHANTMGGNPLACAAAIATLEFMKKNKIGDNAKKIGIYMLKRLKEMQMKHRIIGDVRGLGLMIGIELVKEKKEPAIKERTKILYKALEKGLVLLPAGISVIRLCPPLILTKEEADKGLNIFEDSLKGVK